MRRILLVPIALAGLLAAPACGSSTPPAPGSTVTPGTGELGTAPATPTGAPPANQTTTAADPAWPSPEDCISYDPTKVKIQYEAGIFAAVVGTEEIARVHGGPGDNYGDQLLAVARHYRKHCYIGRNNAREEKGRYTFDYWRDSSGTNLSVPDPDCSSYNNRTPLQVDDMGGGQGWRVKDHDHVLQVFDTESQARNGRLVLQKSARICSIGEQDDDGRFDVINYLQ